MDDYRYSGHTVSRLTVHIVWVTKYRYEVLVGVLSRNVVANFSSQFAMQKTCAY